MRPTFITILSWLVLTSTAQFLNPLVDSIPTRDGKKLAADIYLPGNSATFSVILVQTPYNRQAYRTIGLPLVRYQLQSSNYAFVIADWRCFYGSATACNIQPKRGEDGFDAVNWITAQSWSNGKVGTWGPSALGRVQYMTAREKPQGLVCAVPLVAASQYNYLEYFPGGVARTEYIEQLDDLGFGLSTVLYDNTVFNNIWTFAENQNYYPEEIEIPMFLIGGWYDHNVGVMIDLFDGLLNSSPTNVSGQHRLLMGPWAHGGFGLAQVGTPNQGELSYPKAAGWNDSLALAFLDYHLRGVDNGMANSPAIQYFQMGDDEWKHTSTWPPNNVIDTLFFHDNGALNPNKPTSPLSSSSLVYNPRDPSPTHGGSTLRQDQLQGPYDQKQVVESRNDNLIYSTQELSEELQITGKPRVHLSVSSDRLDTDFAVRLTDVHPDGRSMLISDGIFRMRFRDGFTINDTSAMVPGTIYNTTIDLPELANTFLAGHKLRVIITSSNYPKFDKNLNNGGQMYVGGDTLIATNTVYHNVEQSSFLTFETDMVNSTREQVPIPLMEVSPNPFSDLIYISNTGGSPLYISIFNTLGEKIKSFRTSEYESPLPLSLNIAENGLYILEIVAHDATFTKKIIRNR